MHTRRAPGVSPLAIVLPHPPLPTSRSSLLSVASNGSAPRTPICGSPVNSALFLAAPSRRSTDSWNSSNADELEFEWKPEQIKLLSRTLDALPAHLVTPFNGPIPPPNLLDKIARGVSQAKGPIEWPHGIRATRVKLIELARNKHKDETLAEQQRRTIVEEPEVEIADDDNYGYTPAGVERSIGGRRPPYKQSSMDFLDPAGAEGKQSDTIARLSRRLQQRSDRAFGPGSFHPYSRKGAPRSTSPPPLTKVPSLISPSTHSSDTLDSIDSNFDSDVHRKRRSISSMSSMSIITDGSSGIAIPDPRVQRIRNPESLTRNAPSLSPKENVKPGSNLKRAPSYGAMAQEKRREQIASHAGHGRRDSGSYPSSDEEEKARTKQAKKMRTKSTPKVSTSSPTTAAPTKLLASPMPPPVPEKDRTYVRRTKALAQDENVNVPRSPTKDRKASKVDGSRSLKRPAPMNLQRNPSMFGPELPKPSTPVSPVRPRGGLALPSRARSPPLGLLDSPSSVCMSPSAGIVPASPMLSPSPKAKTLRRVKRLAPGRKISFGSLIGDDSEVMRSDSVQRSCLGSAFQLI